MKYLLLFLFLTGCSTEPKNCMHIHLPDNAIMTYCGKAVECSKSKDESGEMTICRMKESND